MPVVTYEIDPGGDIELVLTKPNDQNIVPSIHFSKDVTDSDDTYCDYIPCLGRYEVFKDFYPGYDTPPDEISDSPVEGEIRMRVSSRHLILASSTFRAMLEGLWSEGTSSSSQSLRQIKATGWDVVALATVLDIIHGRHRLVLVRMNLGFIARVATVVDYYNCHEAVDIYRDKWLMENSGVDTSVTSLCKSSLLCFYASWVLQDPDTISTMAKVVLMNMGGLAQIQTFDLPIGGILGKMLHPISICI
jgi:hypothetical protein